MEGNGDFYTEAFNFFGVFLRDNLLGRSENCCNLNEILILWDYKHAGVFQ